MYNPKSLENLTRRGGGREPGNPNKVTKSVRKKIDALLEHFADELPQWLTQVAEGIRDENGEWINRPNPGQALQIIATFAEYTIPKLSRIDSTVEHSGTLTGITVRLVDANGADRNP